MATRQGWLRRLRIAAVVDEFTRASLDPDVTLRSLDARTWRARLAMFRPDMLFVESTWRGRRDSWRYKVAAYERRDDQTLAALVAYCRRRDIPTVFWNKEDPVHFERFADAARLFDYVFTTDVRKVSDYERVCRKPRGTVHPLMFAVQPAIYHPGNGPRDASVVFAGSYGEPEFARRRRELEMLLDASAGMDLRIFDRNAAVRASPKAFPPRFAPYLRGALGYAALADQYRGCKVALNVNSVSDSPTMFSRRVFEMLACGVCVVSTPSVAIAELFGDIVALVSSEQQARSAIRRFLDDEPHRSSVAARGVAAVLRSHTYAHRVREVCAVVGIGP